MKRAEREAEAMKALESDTFVDLIDYFEDSIGGRRSFVIFEEYIEGATLRDELNNGIAGFEFGIYVGRTLLEILTGFYEKEMYHRDIKPSNIMIDENGVLRLLDVGIVRIEEMESLTPDNLDRMGTPPYAAPEQLDYDKDEQSIKIDIFSTGIVMFESITGHHPFENQGSSITDAIVNGQRADFRDFMDDETGEELELFFETMTHPIPSKRFKEPRYALEFLDSIPGV